MKHQLQWSLKEISEWASDNSSVQIPTIQRGLVWKPQQVEILWDSILRRFPIGAFTLSVPEIEDKPYNLLDGQQRWNAIASGYSKPDDLDSQRAIIWIDIMPDLVWDANKTTRKFFVRVTTKAHPWGFLSDDECSRLNVSQKRDALAEFGLSDTNIYREGINLSQTYPVRSGLPLPLHWFIESGADSHDEQSFVHLIQNKINENEHEKQASKKYRLKTVDVPNNVIGKYYHCFKELAKYQVPTIYLDQRVIDANENTTTKVDDNLLSDIEILFARIGTGGTQITQNELIYSTIKAYWPEELTKKNDVIAAHYMPPFSLIMLAFRLALSPTKDGSLVSPLTIKKVREIAIIKDENYSKILNLYLQHENSPAEIETILSTVNSWLTADSNGKYVIPSVLRTSIARNSPDVFLLLMYLARLSITGQLSINYSDVCLFRAMAFYIHWMFEKGSRAWVVNCIFKKLHNKPVESFSSIIKTVLMDCYAKGYGIPLISKDSMSMLFGGKHEVGKNNNWRTWDEDRYNQSWWPLWSNLCSNRELLIYAQRNYMCDKFQNYDPAKMDMWEEYNRPWDYDHIIAQDWIYQYHARKKSFSDYCNIWKDCNGNIAAIPFEINRSKSNAADWSEYIKEKQRLLADENYEIFNSNITSDANQSYLFAQKTYIRLCKIYSEVYDLLEPVDINIGFESLPFDNDSGLVIRMKRMSHISKELSINNLHSEVYYYYNGKERVRKTSQDWAHQWLSTGIVTKNGYYAAITMEVTGNNLQLSSVIEIGLRRMPDNYEFPQKEIQEEKLCKLQQYESDFSYGPQSAPWWYLYYDGLSITISDEKLIEYIRNLALFAETELS